MKWKFVVTSVALLLSQRGLSVPLAEKDIVKRDIPKAVYAHFMVGIVENYTVEDWKMDMAYAMEIGIDGFALNNANIDSYTPTQLANAYQAAQEVGFKVFISFDFAYWNNGNTAQITAYMQQYANHPAQAMYDGGAIVSTFVGEYFDWAPVKAAVSHKIVALPMMEDPIQVNQLHTSFDGAFSWYAWPTDGGNSIISGPMTTVWDDKFIANLAGRPYMAPVSPWFSTHFNSKNWVFICEQLITDRWNQMLALKPSLIEIITWNDFGESHYISPPEPHHKDDGSSQWADGMPHDGWRIIMKPYIAAYKAGLSAPVVDKDQLVYWYRPTPKNTQCTGDPLGPPNGRDLLADVVFVTTLLTSPGQLTVQSGGNAPVTINVPAGVTTHNFTMGVGSQQFHVSRGGSQILGGTGGLDIKNTCTFYNFNAYVGSFNGTGGGNPPSSSSSMSSTSSSTSTTARPTTSMSTSMSTSSTSTSTTAPPTTTTTTSAIPTSTPSPANVCTAGTVAPGESGNYIGLCNFSCSYGYCPPGPCVCTAYGSQKPLPPTSGYQGCPLPGEGNGYLGLCNFSCSHGYCPNTACQKC